jgi:farnesyl-diphosphate farnesyltransferase
MKDLLAEVSRSFSLSIRVLPGAVQPAISVGYLIARAADTVADTDALPAQERLSLLRELDEVVQGRGDAFALQGQVTRRLLSGSEDAAVMEAGRSTSAERRLLQRLAECVGMMQRLSAGDQGLLRRVLGQLIAGMERDLLRFPSAAAKVEPERVVALSTWAELDEYTYEAAGCVGEFWTAVMAAHLPEVAHLREPDLMRRGICLGKALQMVNVVRDAPADLRAGRCYWPLEVLAPHGLTPAALALRAQGPEGAGSRAAGVEALVAVNRRLCGLARGLINDAWPYVEAIPPRCVRLRLSCTWPLLIGQQTLGLLEAAGSPLLLPERPIKIRREQVYGMLARSTLRALAGAALPAGRF